MQQLKRWDFEVAEIEFTQQDLPHIWIPFTIMTEIADRTIADICVENAPFAPAACHRTGEFLARLRLLPENAIEIEPSFTLAADGFPNNLTPAAIDLGQLQNVIDRFDSCRETCPDLVAAFLQFTPALQQLKETIDRSNYKNVTHRDFLPSQVIVSEKNYGIIDW
jgi:hypothetical protein